MIAAEGVVVPACLRKGLFTVGALDNLDHNPSSTTAMNAFHGTVRIRKDNPGESRPLAKLSPCGSKQHHLPRAYGVVPAVALMSSSVDVPVPLAPMNMQLPQTSLDEAKAKERRWVEHALALIEKGELTSDDYIA